MYTHTDNRKFGTGAKTHSWLKHTIDQARRSKLGMSDIPFDWVNGVNRNYTQPIKNQFTASSCGGQMTSTFLQIYRTVILGLPFEELSADSFYSQGFAPGGGMSLGSVESGTIAKGIATQAQVPTPDGCVESQAESLDWMKNVLPDMLIYFGLKMEMVKINKEEMAKAVRDHGAVCMLIRGQDNGSWLSANPKPPVNNNTWAHFMCSCPSIGPRSTTIPFYQSWGISVGDHGIQYFGDEYINSGYVYAAFTFTKFTFDSTLTYGMSGDSVKRLQYLLYKAGFFDIKNMTGFFGNLTAQAVLAYQKSKWNLTLGDKLLGGKVVGPKTRSFLNS